MVTNVTSFGKNGLYDWVVQRSTAVVLGVYFLGLVLLLWPDPRSLGLALEVYRC